MASVEPLPGTAPKFISLKFILRMSHCLQMPHIIVQVYRLSDVRCLWHGYSQKTRWKGWKLLATQLNGIDYVFFISTCIFWLTANPQHVSSVMSFVLVLLPLSEINGSVLLVSSRISGALECRHKGIDKGVLLHWSSECLFKMLPRQVTRKPSNLCTTLPMIMREVHVMTSSRKYSTSRDLWSWLELGQ